MQIKALLNCYYKVFKDEPVLIFNSRENIRFYWNRLRQLLHLEVPEPTKEPEATLPPVSGPCWHFTSTRKVGFLSRLFGFFVKKFFFFFLFLYLQGRRAKSLNQSCLLRSLNCLSHYSILSCRQSRSFFASSKS